MTRWAVATAMKWPGEVTSPAPGERGDPWGRPQYNGCDVKAALSFVEADSEEEAVRLAWDETLGDEIEEGWQIMTAEAREVDDRDHAERHAQKAEEHLRQMAAVGVHFTVDRNSWPWNMRRKREAADADNP